MDKNIYSFTIDFGTEQMHFKSRLEQHEMTEANFLEELIAKLPFKKIRAYSKKYKFQDDRMYVEYHIVAETLRNPAGIRPFGQNIMSCNKAISSVLDNISKKYYMWYDINEVSIS